MMTLATADSLNNSMKNALKHYSSMFFLPTFRKATVIVATLCLGGVGFSTFAFFLSLEGLFTSLLLGASLFALTLFADYLITKAIIRNDPIYVLRRAVALSLFSWILWLFFIIPGVVLGIYLDILWWINLCLFGFAAVLTFRAVVFITTSSTGFLKRLISSLLSPFLCMLIFLIFWSSLEVPIPDQTLPFFVITPILGWTFALLFVFILDRLGKNTIGVPSIPLFRAFMLNWVAALNAPFESFLEKMGETEEVEITLLKFDSHKTKAAIIVPQVHPGPFKNIGSSLLPSMLKHDFERRFDCDACVPLGILGHELDLASQVQNQKIISQVLHSANFPAIAEKATPFVRITEEEVTASCQVFGKTVFLSFTLAPKTTEDLPQRLGSIVRKKAENLGLECSVLVNAHNSICNDQFDSEIFLENLRRVASKCLQKAVTLPSYMFEIGSSTVIPEEFSLKDGVGAGGITAIVVKVAEQKTVYVVIDGNNMISGLREKILNALKASGFHEGEVFTTDTHAVSALVLGRRGYHPVGEAIDQEVLIQHIMDAAKSAEKNLETCNAGCLRLVVPRVRVIGQSRIESLSNLIDKTIRKAKRIVAPIFISEGLILVLLLAL